MKASRAGAAYSFCALSIVLLVAGANAEEGDFDSDGVRIHYIIEGEGEPVLLIHGYRSSHVSNWKMTGVIRLLAEDYRVIALDNRGHGKSDKPGDPEAYGEKMAADAIRLLDHLGIERPHVVGYSMGGMITMKLLAQHPERVRSAVIGGMGWTPAGKKSAAPAGVPAEPPGDPDRRALWACAQSFGDLGITEAELKGIETPMTVIIGDQDDLKQRRVDPMIAIRPDVPVVLIEKSTHANCIFKPSFRESIKAFIDGVE